MEKISLRRVSRRFFFKKLADVKNSTRNDINSFIYDHEKEIDHYEFGRIPGKRTYIIVLKNGNPKIWDLIKE